MHYSQKLALGLIQAFRWSFLVCRSRSLECPDMGDTMLRLSPDA